MRIAKTVLWVLAFALIAWTFRLHASLLVAPGPLEFREGSIVLTTSFLLEGGDPYALENLPQFTNVYGLVYNFVVLPFAAVFGSTFLVHRAVSGGAIILACILVYCMARGRPGENRDEPERSALPLAGAAVLYWQLVNSYSVVSRPDGLGLCLFLFAFYLPWRLGFSSRGLFPSALMGILAILTKPYFVLSIPAVATYLFVSESKRSGLVYFFGSMAGLAVTVWIIHLISPWYWHCTYGTHVAAIAVSFPYLMDQLPLWMGLHAGILGGLLFATGAVIRHLKRERQSRFSWKKLAAEIDLFRLTRPLIGKSLRFSLPAAGLLVCMGALVTRLGWNTGAYMIYFYQLASPFLIVLAVSALGLARHHANVRIIGSGLFATNLLFLIPVSGPLPDTENMSREIVYWEVFTDESGPFYPAPPVSHLLLGTGHTIYDNGLTEYFRYGFNPDTLDRDTNPGFQRLRTLVLEIREKLRKQEFEVVLVVEGFEPEFFTREQLAKTYRKESRRYLPGYFSGSPKMANGRFVWGIEVWIPRQDLE